MKPSFPHSPDSSRLTVEELAHRLGVAKSTVSLALRNHPKISARTRKKIQQAAQAAGYRPDPVYSELMAHIKMDRRQERGETIAFVSPIEFSRQWMFQRAYAEFYEGARQRAGALGYGMDLLVLAREGVTEKRLNNILITRGIRGVVFASHPDFYALEAMEWGRFSCAAIEFGLTAPKLHRICNHYEHLMNEGGRQLRVRGYRRPGFCMSKNSSERVESAWLKGFLLAQLQLAGKDRIPPHLFKNFDIDGDEAKKWFLRHKPDVIVTDNEKLYTMLQKLNLRVPEDIGILMLNPQKDDGFFAGVKTRNALVGSMAVETVVNQLYRSETGIPNPHMTIAIEGEWKEGKSLRQPVP